MGNPEHRESSADSEFIPIHKNFVYAGAISLFAGALQGAVVVGGMVGDLARQAPNPQSPFEIEKVTRTDITLGQEGKKYVLKIDKLPEEVKKSLIQQSPELESFLTNGPIHIVNTENIEK